MELKELNESKVCDILNEIVELEMAGVVRLCSQFTNGQRT